MISSVQNVSNLSMTRALGAVDTENSASSSAATMPGTAGAANGMSFASIMGNMASDAVNSLKGAESMSFAGIKGTATTREVVDSMLQAEQTLQTAIAIRDKVVSAFLEVTKMQM
ncbi:flagellar hook-basal body complex protein FliE [Rhizobium ruizarguesonis]|jgi:flagellar hook-basal body complex protein FliE|uniref:Flagellar hook-basal body complex protein FliE n=1 Tax=Rhizobium ruizarguesonis TaxID=2081791 RepID=A0AB38HZ88_9HYPH|nr:flagellar hook-basal body complex protein FliE [Rhizobium ruizarguesonis]NEJ20188.1 flagellar hook-basal body complex protein FliE [Rhizobium leguminosarum]NKK58881.1 flagellar hook-basal body complex protein FliE [Rhizobium leguminosarum bv. viciae]NEJ94068.1 flagellar hook-basal body complex protein FliE [Rhizobium ruizarguesonis]TAU03772.1 flagellar hook-basal body complex protein FliE [Rhizobium ruizarguesonis]TAY92086.1 flagellar hook-basal body complex protein FliE [Rhizobium ruizargu